MNWRASRGEQPLQGSKVEEKFSAPLAFQPNTSWLYGTGIDWAGKAIERVTGETLETYMSKKIWEPLGIKDITFWPRERENMKDRIADTALLVPEENKTVHAEGYDVLYGAKDCLGGGGSFSTPEAYFTILQAVLREDPKLLKPESYVELFRPQLNEQCKEALNEVICTDQMLREYFSVNTPVSAKKNWCLARLLMEEDQPGWVKKGTILWSGLPCLIWVSFVEDGVRVLD